MSNILVVHTSWYKEHIKSMIDTSQGILSTDFNIDLLCAPGAIELPALAKHKILKREGSDQEQYLGVLFLGIVVRGETTHYELVTTESFRAIGNLALEYPHLAFINNIICVENKDQLIKRIETNTSNNSSALIDLINEKSS
jgi:6,7-dimethyl-8-ribityllumazine synthase